MSRVLTLLAMLLASSLASAAEPSTDVEKLPQGAKVLKLEARPAKIDLASPFAYAQPIITATLDNGDVQDVTRLTSTLALPKDLITQAPATGLIRPKTTGKGTIEFALGGKSVAIPVTVSGTSTAEPVSFLRDVQPVLSRLGCNAGTCHGAQQGKNGFKLSLRGYDGMYDFRALTDDLEGRRFNRAAPEQSLMLLKTSGAIPHAGGVLTSPGEPAYEMLRRWVAEGVKFDREAVRVRSIELFPKDPTVARPGSKQQFAVIATYTNGQTRDVTAEAFIESSNGEVATVDRTNKLTAIRRGEATMLARYEGAYSASTVVVMGDRSGFVWSAPPALNFIDELVDKKLKRVKVLPSPLCDDAEFIRRIYLDIAGLPPTPEAAQKFHDDPRESRVKREALIESLVGSEAYIEQWTNKWADLLQVNRKFLGDVGATALRKWIRDAVAKNMPYDQFAYSVLTASGSNVENPPASYFKVLRTPDALMENTTQLFLAIRFNCNKCHDHPFERWNQDQYYQMAAFFAQVDRKEDPKFKGQKLGGTAVEQGKPLAEVIADLTTGEVKHERTNQVSAPTFPFEIRTKLADEGSRRERLGHWITDPTNPYFAKSYVNRVWSYLVGTGLIEPIDDIRAGNPPSNLELLDRLTEEFVKSGFDTHKLIKRICQSRTYQLSIATTKWNKDDDLNFSHAMPRRLSAEALYDAVHAVTGSTSRLPGLPPGSRAAQLVDSNVELPGGFLELFGKPVRESACECERSNGMNLGPVLAMVNGPIVADAIKDPSNRLAKIINETKDDTKAVESIYLAVLSRKPTPREIEAGTQAIRAAKGDLIALQDDYKKRLAEFEAYKTGLDAKQAKWEQEQLAQKPTPWTVLEPTNMVATSKAKLSKNSDNSIFSESKGENAESYRISAETKLKKLTGIRLEVLTDAKLPKNGPGRGPENGNFVLSEFKVNYKPSAEKGAPKPVKFSKAEASFTQPSFNANNVIDNNPTSGWAIDGGTGKDQSLVLTLLRPTNTPEGASLNFVLDQNFTKGHVLGKFRLSVTDDIAPRVKSPLTEEETALLSKPASERSAKEKAALRQKYLAQDPDYQRLSRSASESPPADSRLLGAQDLVWALINSPAFLFNH